MEQLKQLIEMRDAAQERLEAARKALEDSPDAKLVSQLSPVIETLAASFGMVDIAPKTTTAAQSDPVEVAPALSDTSDKGAGDIADELQKALDDVGGTEMPVESNAAPEDYSLTDSLEAELLKGGKS